MKMLRDVALEHLHTRRLGRLVLDAAPAIGEP